MRTWSVERVREVERIAIEEMGVSSLILMENAGSGAALHARELAVRHGVTSVRVLCGAGNNGGDGLVVARHLALEGRHVEAVLVADPAGRSSADFVTNLRAARACGVPVVGPFDGPTPFPGDVLVVDALLGTGARGVPRAPFDAWIAAANDSGCPILAVDVPSGLDANTGEGPGALRAERTVTFVAAKPGFFVGDGPACCGELFVQAISIPPSLLADG